MRIFKITENVKGKYSHSIGGGRVGNILTGHEGNHGPVKIENPITPIIPVHKNFKLTDYFGGDTTKKFISQRFYEFLIPYLKEHQVWDMHLTNDVYKFDRKNSQYVIKEGAVQEFYDYKILHISYSSHEIINFKESSFYVFERTGEMKESFNEKGEMSKIWDDKIIEDDMAIANYDSYLSLKRNKYTKTVGFNIPILKAKKIVFSLPSDFSKEVFRLFFNEDSISGYYVSENLKNKIEEQGFTGMSFTPIEEISSCVKIEIT